VGVSNRRFGIAIAASLVLAVSLSAWADFTGKVVSVTDGAASAPMVPV
jgi:hypothetical protein